MDFSFTNKKASDISNSQNSSTFRISSIDSKVRTILQSMMNDTQESTAQKFRFLHGLRIPSYSVFSQPPQEIAREETECTVSSLVISCSGWLKTKYDGGPLPRLSQSPVLLISSPSKLAPNHANELRYSAVLSCGTIHCAVQGDLNY